MEEVRFQILTAVELIRGWTQISKKRHVTPPEICENLRLKKTQRTIFQQSAKELIRRLTQIDADFTENPAAVFQNLCSYSLICGSFQKAVIQNLLSVSAVKSVVKFHPVFKRLLSHLRQDQPQQILNRHALLLHAVAVP